MKLTIKAAIILMILLMLPLAVGLYAAEEKGEMPCGIPQPHGLFMSELDKTPLAELFNKTRINIYGYTEAGYMYDTTAPKPSDGPTFLSF
ncbi:MAG: hypothetical protein HZA72_00720, partial [Candidatus Omnitrophica bacterium]|nr:hypothetical protein [Candidatus Omnitrophota bacterium]